MNLKTFAQKSRRILMKGVERKLHYWGFNGKGEPDESPEPVHGGYFFRGEAYNDPTVVNKWRSLRSDVREKGLELVIEEAAYTWFNRMMAIRILAKNGYDLPQLEFADGQDGVPLILQRARRGTYPFLNTEEKVRLQLVITDFSKELAAFGILIVGYCHSHILLQRVFGNVDDYTELLLPDDILSKTGFLNMLNTTDAVSDEEYRKVELIGWLYQFYISEKKGQVLKKFKQKKKAEASDIPAATQIFTPNWIVKYMVENTVGKLWLDLHPESPIRKQMKYLVEADEKEAPSEPIIAEAAQLKLLDPAAGSGHILVEGFDLLFEMYREEYYSDKDAVESILKNNLFGLDIDKRAVQLAQFAILLKAAQRYPDVLKTDWMPHIYSMPDPVDFSEQELMDFLGNEGLAHKKTLKEALVLMKQGQILGSIIQFGLNNEACSYIKNRLLFLKNKANRDLNQEILLQRIRPYISVILTLSMHYEAIATNPPYLQSSVFNNELKQYCSERYPLTKADLFTVFMDVLVRLLLENGKFGIINQKGWTYKSSFKGLRKAIKGMFVIESFLDLGSRAFDEISGEVVGTVAFVAQKAINLFFKGSYYSLSSYKGSKLKENQFLIQIEKPFRFPLKNLEKIPETILGYWISDNGLNLWRSSKQLKSIADVKKGIATGNDKLFFRFWPEVNFTRIKFNSIPYTCSIEAKWIPINKGGGRRKWSGNFEFVVNWEKDGASIKKYFDSKGKLKSRPQNLSYSFRPGITYNIISAEYFTGRWANEGHMMADVGPTIFSDSSIFLLMGLLNSSIGKYYLGALCPSYKYDTGAVGLFPIISSLDSNGPNQDTIKDNILISQGDWDSHETSWRFEKSPLLNGGQSLNQVYTTWQKKVTADFFQLHANEEELNQNFIEKYGLQDELSPDVPLKEITILQEELDFKKFDKLEPKFRKMGKDAIVLPIKKDEVMRQLISYAMGVFMGRYRLNKPGLHIAHPTPKRDELQAYTYNAHTIEIDDDAIIPLMGNNGQFSDDALHRFKYFLEIVWGPETLVENLNFLQACLDEDIESYLVKGFWKDHCRRYKKRPIYWLFSSPKGAFQVLVYMHRMNAFTAEKIRGNYLMDHIRYLRGRIQRMEANVLSLSSADVRTLDKLRRDHDECEQYDQQLKPIADKQIPFDLDDGVTENYKLFAGVVAELK